MEQTNTQAVELTTEELEGLKEVLDRARCGYALRAKTLNLPMEIVSMDFPPFLAGVMYTASWSELLNERQTAWVFFKFHEMGVQRFFDPSFPDPQNPAFVPATH